MWATRLESIRRPDGLVAMWTEQGGEEQERNPGKEQGPDPVRRVRTLTSEFALYEIVACRVLSKGISVLVCFNSITLPTELSRLHREWV